MATKMFQKSKKMKPKIIQLDDNEENDGTVGHQTSNGNEQHLETTPLISAIEFPNNSVPNGSPSAPPEEEYRPTGLADETTRKRFVQKVYLWLCGQKTLFCTLTALFTFIPHLRKIFRKWVFDPLFYTSFIGFPLCIFVVLLVVSQSIRRKFAFTTLVIITACLSLLISYAITQSTAKAFLYSMGFSNLCDLGVVVGSRKLDFTKWRYISLIPLSMIGSSVLAPTVLQTPLNNTIWPSIIMTSASTYLAANTVPVIRHNDLKLEPHEHVFAASQLYLNPEQSIKYRLKKWFIGTDSGRERSAYTVI